MYEKTEVCAQHLLTLIGLILTQLGELCDCFNFIMKKKFTRAPKNVRKVTMASIYKYIALICSE